MTSLVYLSPVAWSSFAQRPHKFAEWFHAAHGARVLWVDPYPTRLPRWSDLYRLRRRQAEPDQGIPPWMETVRAAALPVEPLPGSGLVNGLFWGKVLQQVSQFASAGSCELVIGKPSRLALRVLASAQFTRSTYDAMDDFPAFYSGFSQRAMARTEQQVAERVSAVQVSATALLDKFGRAGRPVALVRNACSPETLAAVDTLPALRDPARIGYVGTLGSWFDWELVLALALANPDMRLRLTGPLLAPPPPSLPSNVELRPACPHEDAMREMASFAVGLIPFLRNGLTASVDPIKYYEYRALGVPVLSSAFGEMTEHARSGGVTLLDARADLRGVVLDALAQQDSASAIIEFRARNAWTSRFAGSPLSTPAVAVRTS